MEKFDEKSIAVYDAVSDGRNVIRAGEDIRAGSAFIGAGTLIRPQEIGVMASAGVSRLEVYRPWKVSVISTGDELIGMEQEKTEAPSTFAFRPVGYGIQDFPPILEAAVESGAQYVVVEQDAWEEPSLEAARKSRAYLRSLGW